MKKNFCVSVDFVMSKNIYVNAENEEQAKSKVRDMIKEKPYDHACNFSHYVGYEIIDAYEEE